MIAKSKTKRPSAPANGVVVPSNSVNLPDTFVILVGLIVQI